MGNKENTKKNIGGRPSKKEEEKTNNRIHSQLNEIDYKSLTDYCLEKDIKKADFIRESVLIKLGIAIEKKIDPDLLKSLDELNSIGNNVNQIAKKINSNTFSKVNSLMLLSCLDSIESIKKKIQGF